MSKPAERGSGHTEKIILSGKVRDTQDHKEFMFRKDHRLAPKCIVTYNCVISSTSFEKEKDGGMWP